MTATSAGLPRRPAIAWSVLEEHLSEAAFLWAQWERLLDATDHTLAEVMEDDEPRLLAHVEGLVIGGRPVARKLLLPLLEGGEDLRTVCAVAHALLCATDADWLGELLERLTEDDEPLRQGLLRALELSGRTDVSAALLKRLPGSSPELQADLLDTLRHRHCDPGDAISRLGGAPPHVRAAAVRAAGFAPLALAADLVRRELAADDGSVRLAALETGLLRGLPVAWKACRSAVAAGGAEARLGLLALAVGGNAGELGLVVTAAGEPSLRDEACWALGFSGRLAAADALFAALKEDASPLAAESFAAITGLPLQPPFAHTAEEPPPEAQSQDEDEAKADESATAPRGALPPPAVFTRQVDVGQVARWWTHARGRFHADARYLHGHVHGAQVLLSALESLPMRRRAAMAFEVAIRSQGHCLIEPRRWAAVQHRQAQGLMQVRSRNLVVAFESLQAM